MSLNFEMYVNRKNLKNILEPGMYHVVSRRMGDENEYLFNLLTATFDSEFAQKHTAWLNSSDGYGHRKPFDDSKAFCVYLSTDDRITMDW